MQGKDKMMDTREPFLAQNKAQGHGKNWGSEQDKHWEILGEKVRHFSPNGIDEFQIIHTGLRFRVESIATAFVKHNHFFLDEGMRKDSNPFIGTFSFSVFYYFYAANDFRIIFSQEQWSQQLKPLFYRTY